MHEVRTKYNNPRSESNHNAPPPSNQDQGPSSLTQKHDDLYTTENTPSGEDQEIRSLCKHPTREEKQALLLKHAKQLSTSKASTSAASSPMASTHQSPSKNEKKKTGKKAYQTADKHIKHLQASPVIEPYIQTLFAKFLKQSLKLFKHQCSCCHHTSKSSDQPYSSQSTSTGTQTSQCMSSGPNPVQPKIPSLLNVILPQGLYAFRQPDSYTFNRPSPYRTRKRRVLLPTPCLQPPHRQVSQPNGEVHKFTTGEERESGKAQENENDKNLHEQPETLLDAREEMQQEALEPHMQQNQEPMDAQENEVQEKGALMEEVLRSTTPVTQIQSHEEDAILGLEENANLSPIPALSADEVDNILSGNLSDQEIVMLNDVPLPDAK